MYIYCNIQCCADVYFPQFYYYITYKQQLKVLSAVLENDNGISQNAVTKLLRKIALLKDATAVLR